MLHTHTYNMYIVSGNTHVLIIAYCGVQLEKKIHRIDEKTMFLLHCCCSQALLSITETHYSNTISSYYGKVKIIHIAFVLHILHLYMYMYHVPHLG